MAISTIARQLVLPTHFPDEPREMAPPPFPPIVAPAETQRVERDIRPRRCAWLDWSTGLGVTDRGASFATTCPTPDVGAVVELAATAGVERVFLTGERPHAGYADAFYAWAYEAPEGWDAGPHYLEHPDSPVLRYNDGSARCEVLRSAIWWGSEATDPELCRVAWAMLGAAIDDRWPDAVLLATPATTGRELIARTIPEATVWPTLPDDIAAQIRSTSGQGRIELFPPAGDEIGQLVEIDGRTMYGALCRELPGGTPVRGHGEHAYGPYARSRARARWTVPADWAHIGLLPVRGPKTWDYPSTPGEVGEGWIDGVELFLARLWGWDVDVVEHLVWPPGRTSTGPLDGWADRLLGLIGKFRSHRSPPAQLVAQALRHVLIDAIGALVGRPHIVTRSTPIELAEAMPANAVDPRLEAGHLVWGEPQPPKWPEMVHPEWAATIWARCRVRMLDGPPVHGVKTGALHLDPGSLLAIRTDALYVVDDPRWPDDGQPGRLRTKRRRPGPLPSPRSVTELLALRDGAS